MLKRNPRNHWIELSAPLFLVSLAALLLNDFWWKSAFHNDWTGKISDFAGLYAFAWVALTLIRSKKWPLILGIALFFLWFKSEFSSGFLTAWNATFAFQIQRVVDLSDCWALMVLPIAAINFERFGQDPITFGFRFELKPIFRLAVLALSIFAFVATTESTTHVYEKSYSLNASPAEVIQKLNALEKSSTFPNPSISLMHENANEFVDQGNIRLFYHHNQTQITEYDTILGKIGDSIFIDQIHPYTTPAIDTVYVNPEGFFKLNFDIVATNSDSILCSAIPCILRLEAKGSHSELTLVQIKVHNCPLERGGKKGSTAEYLREKFEAYFLKALK